MPPFKSGPSHFNRGNPAKPFCPPPLIRQTPQGPCVRPAGVPVRSPAIVTPFGGPASGLWPSGSRPISSPVASIPSCLPTMFDECFAQCIGSAPPDVVCGWDAPGSGGTVVFTPGQASFDGPPSPAIIRIRKLIPNPVSLFGITGQYKFTEFDSQTAADFYDISLGDAGLVNALDLFLEGDGVVYFQVGPVANSPFYNGMWTPNGGTHVVHYTVDSGGVPTLYIDGVLINLVLMGSQVNFANAPDNSINVEFSRNNVGVPARMFNYFLTAGIFPPTTVFCCG